MHSFKTKFQKGSLVIYFFIFLCIACVVMALILSQQNRKIADAAKQIEKFEIFSFLYQKITPFGVEVIANGIKAKQNKEGQEELEDFVVKHYLFDERKIETLTSSFAIHKNDNIYMPQGATYQKDALNFWSEVATYEIKTKNLLSQGDFKIIEKNYQFNGKNAEYKNGKIYAKDIKGILQTGKKL
ncbi:hypothetical protein B6S12_01170 [Helicobacter valdiviensis]|uniref:LPS export ABC transporter periplasmic protein LptC n=1 Tax=Helicobacter valdiviensis TaxID=1458358 RepID=A0A2W6NNB1_9HELI|nr:hypothetical protein [Helicobacter valdiviensis]PZT48936.1 hypothetical protein B6S12_01170 [Helicobacter valdiviensis]